MLKYLLFASLEVCIGRNCALDNWIHNVRVNELDTKPLGKNEWIYLTWQLSPSQLIKFTWQYSLELFRKWYLNKAAGTADNGSTHWTFSSTCWLGCSNVNFANSIWAIEVHWRLWRQMAYSCETVTRTLQRHEIEEDSFTMHWKKVEGSIAMFIYMVLRIAGNCLLYGH